jgi:hypothetical protein
MYWCSIKSEIEVNFSWKEWLPCEKSQLREGDTVAFISPSSSFDGFDEKAPRHEDMGSGSR